MENPCLTLTYVEGYFLTSFKAANDSRDFYTRTEIVLCLAVGL